MVLPLIIIIGGLAVIIIFALFIILGAIWVFSNPWQTAIIALVLAFLIFLWKYPKQRKKLLK